MSSDLPIKIIFAGTPDFSALVLKSILDAGHNVCAVYCQPDRRVGRGKKLASGPVKSLAVEKGIAVEQPTQFSSGIDSPKTGNQDQGLDQQDRTPLEKLLNYEADLMIVVAYGLILPQRVLDAPKHGCVNIHASLLPRWRGAAPIQRAIEQGDEQTGITIMQMDKGLDTGNMLLKRSCDIVSSDTGETLHDRLAEISCNAINEFLVSFSKATGSELAPGQIQDNQQACYAHKLNKAEAEIDWSKSAQSIDRKIRAFNSWPVSFTFVGDKRLRIWQAHVDESESNLIKKSTFENAKAGEVVYFDKNGIAVKCGNEQMLILTTLQADGSRSMSAAELLNSKSQWFIEHPILGKIAAADRMDKSDIASNDITVKKIT